MQSKTIISLFLACIVLFWAGCEEDFLSLSPSDSLSPDNFYRNEADAESAVNAAYDPLQNVYNISYPNSIEGGTDDIDNANNVSIPTNSWAFSANFSRFDEVWQALYQGAFRSNLVLQNVPDIDMDENTKNRILGEARFLRALYYWHLTSYFGPVPMVTEANPTDASVGAKPASAVADIYNQVIIPDLQEAKNLLPPLSEYGSDDIGRATLGAAQALLGKVYLYNQDYAMAQQELQAVIESGEYQLLADFQNINVVDNNVESIFEVQYSTAPGEDNTRLDYNLPQGQGGWGNRIPEQNIVDEFEDYNGPDPDGVFDNKDPRLFYSVWQDGEFYDNEAAPEGFQAEWTFTGLGMKKGQFPVTRGHWDSPWNECLIRLGDVYLMAAEAAALKSGSTAADKQLAIDWINEVRSRVNMPTYPDVNAPYSVDPSSSRAEFFESIAHERRVELAFELHRLNDLRRWEDEEDSYTSATERLSQYGYQPNRHQYFPYPQEEVDANPELEQNPAYTN
ncbi:RagB/SusD family nutrient uptake outer membrane protein [Aliifodinibius sp. S!AR15-10]|uniref:RagB/SusD family nutrient uptake outer membrane protein n=1 Tax=Aliifodinibius sp. S!AR15-10 TaxID=2950437 RepID=UPI00285658EF|nr:RagB/SusD family nutrient uptake outer membrane protein [Aliifodinibius sp. S!AR15-10]MDR8394627.1 RagB/SusD family nutrient uptake outer membrane protein [Aliifodinibius sp. S!AR15-10]